MRRLLLVFLVMCSTPPVSGEVFNYITPVDVTPSTANSWQDVDVTGYTSADATGVIVQWINQTGTQYNYAIRKKGSTDFDSDPLFWDNEAKPAQQGWLMIGVDSNQVFEIYTGNTGVKTYLVGYTRPGAWFFTNWHDKSLTSTGSWQNIDISSDTGTATAIGAIFLVHNVNGSSQNYGLRMNGSGDTRVDDLRADIMNVGIIGVDGSEICQGNIGSTDVDFYLVGYITSGAKFFTTAVDKSTGTTGSYQPVDITANIGSDDANGAIVEVYTANNRRSFGLRKNGDTYNYYDDVSHQFALVGIDAGDIFEQQIELTNMDLYLVGYTLGNATSVDLISFTAKAADGAVELDWETGSELKNLGFHVYRAESTNGPYTRITTSAIPGLGSSPQGARYRYTDSGLENGKAYYYKLEDVETTGKTTMHGPVSAKPETGQVAPAPSPDGIVYGRPDGASMTILSQNENEMVLELRTGGFTAEPLPDGSVRLSVPDFVLEPEAGRPEIPRWRSWLPVPEGRRVHVTSIDAADVEAFSSLRPSMAGALEVVASRQGTIQLASRRTSASLPHGLYPQRLAAVLSEAYQQEKKKALVELSPLRWDGARGLLLARRLIVRLSFAGRERNVPDRGSARIDVVRRLRVRDKGLYALRFEELWDAGRSSLPTSSLRLSHQGEPVPFHVEPSNTVFGPGSTLYFLSEGRALNPYGDSAVYELERASGAEMTTGSASPSGASNTYYYWHELSKEENRYYQAGLLDATDLWLWDVLFAPTTKTFPFEIRDLASAPESASLRVFLQGVSDLEGPDHHVRLHVNGALVAESRFEGKLPEVLSTELPPGVLREGVNELQIENVGDTGVPYSMVMLDRFALSYPRLLHATDGRLEGGFTRSGVAEVSGLSSDAVVLDITEEAPRWLQGAEASDAGIRFRADAGHRYLAVSPAGVLKPFVEQKPASRLTSRLMRADYLVIGPRELLSAAPPLLTLRRNQALLSRAVPLDEIYSEFGYGEARPQAIRDFLAYTYHSWRKPAPRYVLLLGDGTYDFQDYLKTGVMNQVPPFLVKTSYLWTASDSAYASVNGDDLLPDVAIGRLPAANLSEAQVMVAKVLAYEANGNLSRGPVVLVADNGDEAGDFVTSAEELARGVLAPRNPERIYLDTLGTDATRAAITDAFNRGASLLSYIGHGGISLWANENIFDTTRVGALDAQSQQPVVLTMNCLNGYFHFPYFNSLGEELVKAEGKGAIAAFSPSGLSLNAPAGIFHRALLEEILSGRHRTLGDAVLAAQAAYAASGAFPELLRIYNLLGDPALRLK